MNTLSQSDHVQWSTHHMNYKKLEKNQNNLPFKNALLVSFVIFSEANVKYYKMCLCSWLCCIRKIEKKISTSLSSVLTPYNFGNLCLSNVQLLPLWETRQLDEISTLKKWKLLHILQSTLGIGWAFIYSVVYCVCLCGSLICSRDQSVARERYSLWKINAIFTYVNTSPK